MAMAFKMATTGMWVADECKNSFMEMKWKKVHIYIVFKIDEGSRAPECKNLAILNLSSKVIHLNKIASTHADIIQATGNFSENRVIGKDDFGTVYRGIFPDGIEVAVKKLQREGLEGEREFKANDDCF